MEVCAEVRGGRFRTYVVCMCKFDAGVSMLAIAMAAEEEARKAGRKICIWT